MLDCVLSIQNSTPLVGIDLGSTTAKLVLVEQGRVTWCRYERHLSKVREAVLLLLAQLKDRLGERPFRAALSGSAGLGLSQQTGMPFVQEVFATSRAVSELAPDTDVVIELGGEDAKVLFLTGGADQRMNGTCAGGTGAFIDQMATLLGVTVEQLDRLSLSHRQIYPIASRCGVFAKSDIQPLLNQGARKEDLAASIYQAVVNQTITGLAQGRPISGRVMFLGGPLYYCRGLRERFVQTLGLSPQDALFPEYSRFAVAIGAALCAQGEREPFTCDTLTRLLQEAAGTEELLHPWITLDTTASLENDQLVYEDGSLSIAQMTPGQVQSVTMVAAVDGKEVGKTPIPWEDVPEGSEAYFPFDTAYPAASGRVFTLSAEVVDSYGLRYVILVDQLSLQPDSGSAVSTPEDGPEGAASMKVYSSQGSLLWEGRMDTFPY